MHFKNLFQVPMVGDEMVQVGRKQQKQCISLESYMPDEYLENGM